MPPLVMGRDTPLAACLELTPKFEEGFKMAADLRTLYDADPDAKRVIDVARGLEGLRRQDGIHAAAVVITPEPLTEYLPIQRKPDGGKLEDAPIVTQYEMNGVADLGLLKMDFLGLRNLDVMEVTLDLIEHTSGRRPDIDRVALDDDRTFELLRRGETIGVFQLEGGPMRALLRSLAPTNFEDVAALVALYRPGPMGTNMHNEYADRKNGRKPITYYHPDVEEILAPTYGLMIYQEQLMRVAQRLAGYSLAEANALRKVASKKQREQMAKERDRFVEGCVDNGHTPKFAGEMFAVIEPFADYSFPKAHATGYGLVAYQTAYLKANHPVEYLAALLTSVKTNKDQTAIFLNECRQLGIDVLVPDVNASLSDFSVRPADPEAEVGSGHDKPAIHFGMSAVRNVGEGVVAQIVAARDESGPFGDFYDFCDRVDPSVLNKRTIESLAKAGGFDSLGHPRQGLVEVHELILDTVIGRRRKEADGQFDLFSALAADPAANGSTGAAADLGAGSRTEIPDVEYAKSVRLAFEKEMLGLYVSEHPMLGAERALRKYIDCTLSELRDAREGEMRSVGGVVTAMNRKYTKRGDLMGTFVLEDLAAALEVMVFPKTMSQYGHLLADDAIVVIKGRVDQRDDIVKVIAMEVTRPELVLDGGPPVRIKVRINGLSDAKVTRLKELLSTHPGDSPVFVHLESPEKTTVLRLGDEHLVDAGNGLFAELRVLLGSDCIA